MKKATQQETFDHVVTALRTQGRPSAGAGGLCLYRGPGGAKCAAGHCIPDDVYTPSLEEKTVDQLPAGVFSAHDGNRELLKALQDAHDECQFGSMIQSADTPANEWLDSFLTKAASIAQDRGLDPSSTRGGKP